MEKSSSNKYGFNKNYIFYNQDDFIIKKELPFFVCPISSVANINIEAIKFALFEGVRAFGSEDKK